MALQVRYFASLREKLQCEKEFLDNPDIQVIADLRRALSTKYPNASDDINNALCAVNLEYADDSKSVTDSDEIAFFPPVTGG